MAEDNIVNSPGNFDIAVIGMAGRFPGAKDVDEFWQALRAGRESITFFSDEELKKSGIDPSLLADPYYVKASAVLDKPEYFDAGFFKYSPREAETMDPQQRLFLEVAWEAVENAGYDPERYPGSIGVYAGASRNTYVFRKELVESFAGRDLMTVMGNDNNFVTTRVSYKLNLKGPSVAVQTACSTSLVAIHMACQSLLNQECDMALAGGVCIRFPHRSGYIYQPGNIPSPDGHCRAFDEKAEGTVFGNGAGAVLLKRLADAVRDGDFIRAVIKGSATNNDGHLKVDYTAPSVEGQSQVILEALASSGIEADSISFIEAHGTGTALGDPIEVAALNKAFRSYTDKNGFCTIGSVKTNTGHLDVAAGVTSFIKTVMALEHKEIPPTLHFRKPNPEIDFTSSPFRVNNQLMAWQAPFPRRAGVSSFGIGGTNAHVILEEAPVIESDAETRPYQLLLLSARSESALDTATANLIEHLKAHSDISLADAAFTLQKGRKAFGHKRVLVCRDVDDAIKALEEPDKKRVLTHSYEEAQRDVVFIFSGQGSQYVNMGLDLYKTEPVFREEVDRCCAILQPYLGVDLHDVIYPQGPVTPEASERLTQTVFTQVGLFVIEYSLAKLWMSWGIRPAAMVGHSIGELVAACLAGVFTLEDALKLVAARGRLMQEMPGGSMLAVFLSEKELQPFLNERLSVAVINLPSLCVVSGDKEAVAGLEKQLSERKVLCRNVRTSHAFHSKSMDPVVSAFAAEVKKVNLNAPQIPFLSNVSGTWITAEEAASPEYWGRHLRYTVRYSDCVGELLQETNRILLEVGPGNTFSSLARQHPDVKKEHIILASTHHPKEETPDTACILNTLGQLWMAGVAVDWDGFYTNEKRRRVPLPTYPFERQRYSVGDSREPQGAAPAITREEEARPVRGRPDEQETASDALKKDVEQTMREIWQDILGVRHINGNESFFDLGGTSLMAVNLFSEIEKKFGKRLPLNVLLKAPSLKQLVAVIREDKAPAAWTSLVEIQSGGSGVPLFLIHAAGGNLLIYRNLIRHLGPDQTVYGLQVQGLDGTQPVLDKVEDMAAEYVKEIQEVSPEGPYLLAGYCMGGSIALEMAQQLREQGKDVALVALMETYNFSHQSNKLFSRMRYRFQQIEFHLRNLMLTDRKMMFLKEKARVAWGRKDIIIGSLLAKLGLQQKTIKSRNMLLSSIWKTCDLAAVSYIPRPYAGTITEFKPMIEYACFSGPEKGWEKLAAGGLDTCVMPVYPRGMLVEPFVGLLAEKMKEHIRRALERYASEIEA